VDPAFVLLHQVAIFVKLVTKSIIFLQQHLVVSEQKQPNASDASVSLSKQFVIPIFRYGLILWGPFVKVARIFQI
jgi:hypothetical protein